MAANSALRRITKQVLRGVLKNDRAYQYFQAVSKAMDIRNGSWSEPELDLIPLAIRPGETVLDLGANFGLYTYHLSRALHGNGQIYAFEPVPFTYATLRLVGKLLRFRNATLIEKGCSDRTGKITFEVPVQTSGALATGQAYIGGRRDDREGKEQQVRWDATTKLTCEVVTLDEFLPDLRDVSLIKCDIEGAELLAFRGGEKMIDQHLPSVICEINPWFLEGFGIPLKDLTGFFFDKGFGLYHYRANGDHKALFAVDIKDVVEDNYIFIHPRRLSRFSSILANASENSS